MVSEIVVKSLEPRNPSWISERFTVGDAEGGKLLIGGVSIGKIAEAVPTPFFVYDAGTIKGQYDKLNHAMSPHGIEIYYSMKPNSSLAVVDGLRMMGAGLEIASLGELFVAQEVGANPKKISFAGPVKSEEELLAAISWEIRTINAECEEEFYRINEIAGRRGVRQKVGIRINPEKEVEGAGGLMGGGPRKFGIDDEKVTPEFLKKIAELPNVDLVGVHIFAATQILDAEAFLDNLRNVCSIAERVSRSIPLEYVDLGGGLGIPYQPGQQSLPLGHISSVIGETLKDFPFLVEQNVRLLIEPGRFLVGPSGIYVTKVDHIKESRGTEYVMVDGGWHQMMRSSPKMPFGPHPIYNLSRLNEPMDRKMEIAGPLCTSIDQLGTDVSLPAGTREGDLIGIFNAGAYGRSQSPLEFLSHAKPAEVLVGQSKFVVIRKAESPRELLRKQIIPLDSAFV